MSHTPTILRAPGVYATRLLFGLLLSGLLLWLPALQAQTQTGPRESRVPGGVAHLALPNGDEVTRVSYDKRRVALHRTTDGVIALVGIPLQARPGKHEAVVQYRDGSTTLLAFEVEDKQYTTQHLTIENKRMVNPNQQDLERIAQERKLINTALATWSQQALSFGFQAPVSGRFSSSFGLRRVFNGQPRNPHSGMDIAAPQGTEVIAPAGGRVIETGHYFFSGNTVFLDHGQGLISLYSHLDSITVTPGQQLQTGEVLGTVGMTGRVTGPHLHWAISLNNTKVDPALFLPAELLARQQP